MWCNEVGRLWSSGDRTSNRVPDILESFISQTVTDCSSDLQTGTAVSLTTCLFNYTVELPGFAVACVIEYTYFSLL